MFNPLIGVAELRYINAVASCKLAKINYTFKKCVMYYQNTSSRYDILGFKYYTCIHTSALALGPMDWSSGMKGLN